MAISVGSVTRAASLPGITGTWWTGSGYLRWRPAEADTPLRTDHWFWHPNDEKSLKPLGALIETYHKTVGRGAQLMIGLAPDSRGLLPESDVARLREFGSELRRIYGPAEVTAQESWHPAAPLVISSARPMTFDRAVVMERLELGQRVARYAIEVWEAGRWRTVAQGTTIGHKKMTCFRALRPAGSGCGSTRPWQSRRSACSGSSMAVLTKPSPK